MTDYALEEGQSLNFAVASANLSASLARIQSDERRANAVARKPKPESVRALGRLAKATKETSAYAEAGMGAKVLFRIPKDRYLVVRPGAEGRWAVVVLDDRTLAYVPMSALAVLAFEVTEGGIPPKVGDAIAVFALGATDAKAQPQGKSLRGAIGNGEFVALAYSTRGIVLPASPAAQAEIGVPVTRYEKLVPGDRLYLWDESTDRIGQAAIYVGGNQFVMADPKSGKVTMTALSESVRKRIVAARR